ncbi:MULTISPECIES: peptidase domain-containing ABC transporter [unclassified Gilliamella]|uniref:peptidase domain-containing ABC transporter n=1 Tax=unclassified Gilliamella TaxID=2685620 RepID=UPI00130C5D8A|nr:MULTISPECIES: peptidase domain-containing ABC transporter [unclassified Gilliamella]MWP48429.1 ATP-binding cassette domain-containing protein [Gilliamella sp. Lep-s35]MWP68292.1 ATP-binding cassette domain-containing protein [Gilliamella sp. Lep-s5]MWP76569.1 ATP-binding cassette domain-containing protein [Gilliamella sp. Lep-s21]
MMKEKLDLQFKYRNRLPMHLQNEGSECGLACLTMIVNYWGFNLTLMEMRNKHSFSLRGASLKNIIHIANELKFSSRPLRLELDQLKNLKCPCILHWDLNHFVVLKKVRGHSVFIHDPAVGKVKLKIDEVSHHFTGVAIEFTPTTEFLPEKKSPKISFKSVMGNVIGLKKGLFQLLVLGIMIQVCTLISPLYLRWIVDDVIAVSNRGLLTVLGIGFTLLVLLRISVEAVRSWFTAVFSTQLSYQWRGNVFSHILNLPLEWFQRRHLADIVSRFHSIQEIQDGLTTKVVASIVDGLLVITTFAMMCSYNFTLAMISVFSIFLYVILRWFTFSQQRNITSQHIISRANQESHFLESIRGMQSIRLYNHHKERYINWMNLSAKEFNAHLRLEKFNISFQFANTLIFSLDRIIVIWIAASLILDNLFSIGMLFAFMSYKEQLSDKIVSLIDKICDISMLKLHVERLADIVFSPVERNETGARTVDKRLISDFTIELKNISFRYSDNDPFVLKNINLTIPMGQCLAITGPSGCGKTTLLKIVLGLLKPTEGQIFIGETPLSNLDINYYRGLIGTVMQDDHLFAGTIADNICFFDSEPEQEKIEHYALKAAIHEEIVKMPMKYNTIIGDIGTGLSGGQKQRVLFARALYREPKILALDEATSHLDIANEKIVNTSIIGYHFTKLVVAHRAETINMADRVVLLDNGLIVEDSLNTCVK